MPEKSPRLKAKAKVARSRSKAATVIAAKEGEVVERLPGGVAAQAGGRRTARIKKLAPWEPSPRDLEMFDLHLRFISYSEIGKRFGCSHAYAHQVCVKVSQWSAQRSIDSIEAIRGQVMQTYSYCVKEAIETWEKTKAEDPDPRYLETAMKGLGEIRKLWAADRLPEKKGGDENKRDDGFSGERVAGKSQTEMLAILVAKITKATEAT